MISISLYNNNLFEVVRDKIVEIIYLELTNQYNIALDENNFEYQNLLSSFAKKITIDGGGYAHLDFNLFPERFVRLDSSELNAIVIYWDSATLGKGTQTKCQENNSKINIDVYVKEKGNESIRGDVFASFSIQKILGIIRSVIMHTEYIHLGLQRSIINRRWVDSMDSYRPQENQNAVNAENVITGNLSLSVEFEEQNLGYLPVLIESNYTTVTVDENGRYKIENDNLKNI